VRDRNKNLAFQTAAGSDIARRLNSAKLGDG